MLFSALSIHMLETCISVLDLYACLKSTTKVVLPTAQQGDQKGKETAQESRKKMEQNETCWGFGCFNEEQKMKLLL